MLSVLKYDLLYVPTGIGEPPRAYIGAEQTGMPEIPIWYDDADLASPVGLIYCSNSDIVKAHHARSDVARVYRESADSFTSLACCDRPGTDSPHLGLHLQTSSKPGVCA